MNEDHASSLKAYCHHYAKESRVESAILIDLDSKGMYMNAMLADKSWKTGIFVAYTQPLKAAAEIRKLVVAMHKEAYAALKWKDSASGVLGVLGHIMGHLGAKGKVAVFVVGIAAAIAIANLYVKVEFR